MPRLRRSRSTAKLTEVVKLDDRRAEGAVSPLLKERLIRMPRRQKLGDVAIDPFQWPQFPKEVIPPARVIAQDQAIPSSIFGWASSDSIASAYAEGVAFFGYSYLSALAQRAEYRVVSETIASECTREWIELKVSSGKDAKNDKVKELDSFLEDELHLRAAAKTAVEQDGYFGRSHWYLDTGSTDDPRELKMPLGNGRDVVSRLKIGNKEPKKKLKAVRVVEPVWAYPTQYESTNPLKPDWYNPVTWYVMSQPIHRSRFLTFVGRPVPDMLKPAYAFGGLSMSQMLKPYVDNWLRTRQSVSDLVQNFSNNVLKTNMDLTTGLGGDKLLDRVAIFNAIKNNQGTMVLDKTAEDWQNISVPLGGLDSLQAQSQEHMAAIARVPLVKLLGIQPAGLNASSEGELISFEDWIAAYQETFLRPNLTPVFYFAQLTLWGEIDPDITFEFKPLRQLKPLEEAQLEATTAQTRDTYVTAGAVTPAELREAVAKDENSPFGGLDLSKPLPEPEPDLEEGMGTYPGEEPPAPNMGPGGLLDGGDGYEHPFAADAGFEEGKHPRGGKGGEHGGQFVKKGQGGGKASGGARAHLKVAHEDRSQWPAHIKALKIPPAWTSVKISQDPKADLLAVSKDVKGRAQYVYSQQFSDSQAAKKFERVKSLVGKLQLINNQNTKNLRSSNPTVREAAAAQELIMKTGLRPGSEADTGAAEKAYGATTLQGQHVVVDGSKTYLRFVGKKGVKINLPIDDRQLAASLRDRAKKAGANGQLFDVSAPDLRNYVKTLNGGDFKVKDFRTALGTSLAHNIVSQYEPPTDQRTYKRAVLAVAKQVSERLGNTPAIALKAYISPFVFSEWKQHAAAA